MIRRLLSETEHDWIYKKPLPVDFGQIAPDFRGDTLKSNYSIRISDLHFCRFWKNKVKGLTQQIRWRLTVEHYLPRFLFLKLKELVKNDQEKLKTNVRRWIFRKVFTQENALWYNRKIQNRSEMLLLLAIPSEKLTYFSEV